MSRIARLEMADDADEIDDGEMHSDDDEFNVKDEEQVSADNECHSDEVVSECSSIKSVLEARP